MILKITNVSCKTEVFKCSKLRLTVLCIRSCPFSYVSFYDFFFPMFFSLLFYLFVHHVFLFSL